MMRKAIQKKKKKISSK